MYQHSAFEVVLLFSLISCFTLYCRTATKLTGKCINKNNNNCISFQASEGSDNQLKMTKTKVQGRNDEPFWKIELKEQLQPGKTTTVSNISMYFPLSFGLFSVCQSLPVYDDNKRSENSEQCSAQCHR